MFVRRLVSGVRSSCEASWTSWRCRCCASSSDSSIALNVAASRLSSSVPVTWMRWERSRVVRTCSAVSLRSRTGFERRARDEEAERRARSRCRRARRAAARAGSSTSSWSTFVERRGDHDRERRPGSGVVSRRTCWSLSWLLEVEAARARPRADAPRLVDPGRHELRRAVAARRAGRSGRRCRRAGTGCRTGSRGTWSRNCFGAIVVGEVEVVELADLLRPDRGGCGRPGRGARSGR